MATAPQGNGAGTSAWTALADRGDTLLERDGIDQTAVRQFGAGEGIGTPTISCGVVNSACRAAGKPGLGRASERLLLQRPPDPSHRCMRSGMPRTNKRR